MCAVRAVDAASEPNRFVSTGERIEREQLLGQAEGDPWDEALPQLDDSLEVLEQFALQDQKRLPAAAVGPVAVAVLRGNPKLPQKQLRVLAAGALVVDALKVVFNSIAPVLLYKTSVVWPRDVANRVEEYSEDHPNVLQEVVPFRAFANRSAQLKMQTRAARVISAAEKSLAGETDVDSSVALEARMVLIHLKCGSHASEIANILETSTENVGLWLEAVEDALGQPDPLPSVPQIDSPKMAARLLQSPSDNEMDRAESILLGPNPKRTGPVAVRRHAEILLSFRDDSQGPLALFAEKMGVSRLQSEKILDKFVSGFGPKEVAQGRYAPGSRDRDKDDGFSSFWLGDEDDHETSSTHRSGGRPRSSYAPSHEEVVAAEEILELPPAPGKSAAALRRRAEVILALRDEPKISRQDLAEKQGVTYHTICAILKEFKTNGFPTEPVAAARTRVARKTSTKEMSKIKSEQLVRNQGGQQMSVQSLPGAEAAELWVPWRDDVETAQSISDEVAQGKVVDDDLLLKVNIVVALGKQSWLTSSELAAQINATSEEVVRARRELKRDNGLRLSGNGVAQEGLSGWQSEQDLDIESVHEQQAVNTVKEPRVVSARKTKQIIKPTEAQMAHANLVLQRPEPDKLRARAERRMAQMVVALHKDINISNLELAELLGVTDGRIPQMRGELIAKGFGSSDQSHAVETKVKAPRAAAPKTPGPKTVVMRVDKDEVVSTAFRSGGRARSSAPAAKTVKVAKERQRLTYQPRDDEIAAATSVMDRVNTGEVVPKGQVVRAKLILELVKDPNFSTELAQRVGVASNDIYRYRKELITKGGFGIEPRASTKTEPAVEQAAAKVKLKAPRLEKVTVPVALEPTSVIEIPSPPVGRRVQASKVGESKRSGVARIEAQTVATGLFPTEEEVAMAKLVLENNQYDPSRAISPKRHAELIMGYHQVTGAFKAMAESIANRAVEIGPKPEVKSVRVERVKRASQPRAVHKPQSSDTKTLRAASRQVNSDWVPTAKQAKLAAAISRKSSLPEGLKLKARVLRTFYKSPDIKLTVLADRFGVTPARISQIRTELKGSGLKVPEGLLV